MSDISLSDIILQSYKQALAMIDAGNASVVDRADACHLAPGFAIITMYGKKRSPNHRKHYDGPIDRLYRHLDRRTIKLKHPRHAFAYVFLKVMEIEKVISKQLFLKQLHHELKGRG